MSENRFPCGATDRGMQKPETVCIDTNRVLDSCRDRDCFEDVKVLLTSFGNDILEHTTNIRAKSAHIECTQICIDPIRFNRGFYSVNIKFFVRICLEACLCGGRTQDFDGIAVLEKKVILYGSESNVSVFKSSADCSDFCKMPEPCSSSRNVPIAVVEAIDPIILNAKVREPEDTCNCCCCCCCGDVPHGIAGGLGEQLNDSDGRFLTVSLGIFSVVRIVRPAQYIITATEYCVPDKVCISTEDDNPCAVFRSMAFPTSEFCPPDYTPPHNDKGGKCGCGNN